MFVGLLLGRQWRGLGIWSRSSNIGALVIRIGFGVYYTIIIIRNYSNYSGTYSRRSRGSANSKHTMYKLRVQQGL